METFGKIKTNRASVKKYMELFKKQKQGDESFISPRSLPGSFQADYYILFKFPEESKNRLYFSSLKSFARLSDAQYKTELEALKFSWEV